MSDEAQPVVEAPAIAETPAPDQVATAAPETEAAAPEVADGEQKPSKVFTQEELDAIVQKRLAQERRKMQREQQAHAEAPKPVVQAPVGREQFASDEAYVEALAEQKAQAKLIAQQEAEQRHRMLSEYHDREEAARDKYEDFEQVAYNPKVPITETMAHTIQASELGPDIAYYLGTNPKDALRIANLSPLMQVKELGRLEAKIASEPVTKKVSTAPAPISPVTARSVSTPAYDTTDPRSIKAMSTSQWIEAENARMKKKLEAKGYR